MNYEVLEALRQIAQEKNVGRDLVVETLEIGLISAAKKRFGTGDNVEVEIDSTQGTIRVVVTKTVVEAGKVEDPGLEIEIDAAREIDPAAEVGATVREELPFSDFGRNAIQTAKQILVQRVREAERERIFEDYQGRIGEIISGTVQQISRGDILINIGRTEAVVPLKEQIRKERYRQGDPIRAILVNVLRTSKGPQVVLSRTHATLLHKLFQLEVPEIYEGVIEIKAVAREPGERAKIAVFSNDARIDPVGACVGMKGSRVQAVVRELSNERIDIVPWVDDEAIFLSRALSPAQVKRVVVDRRIKTMSAIVDDDQLSLAIGKSGQNARLAAQLTGWKVDILTETRFREIQEEKAATLVPLEEVPGIGKVTYERLVEAGVHSANDIAATTTERLMLVPGVGEATSEKLHHAATELVAAKVAVYRAEVERRKAEAAAARAAEEAAKAEAARIEAEAKTVADAAAAEVAAAEAAAAEATAAEAAAVEATTTEAVMDVAPEAPAADAAAGSDAGAGSDAAAGSDAGAEGGDVSAAEATSQAPAEPGTSASVESGERLAGGEEEKVSSEGSI